MKKSLLCSILLLPFSVLFAQGSWIPLNNLAPDTNGGVMLLLTDGTVIAKTYHGGADGMGNTFDKLTPDANGSYVNGTWSTIAPMHDTRLYFSSQILQDGRVYVAGGEYGTGGMNSEVYDPLLNTWSTPITSMNADNIADANSEILDNGKIIQAVVSSTNFGWNGNYTYDIATNSFTQGATSLRSHDESAWLKLPDGSILFPDLDTLTAERYIPSLDQWIADAPTPVHLYDPNMFEMGGAELLPNGKAFFVGGNNQNLIYTPTGTTAPGTWTIAANFPNNLGVSDGACAMMGNGKILCAAGPITGFYSPPIYYYEYDYITDTFTPLTAPDGNTTNPNASVYYTNMLCLPDGNILYCDQGSNQYYIYAPFGAQLASGKPTVGTITQLNCNNFRVHGTLFNGISQGASYGDDWQMSTNYPIVRLTAGSNVYYARSSNWNSTGVMRGSLPDSCEFYISNAVPIGTYQLQVIANGIASTPVTFNWTACAGISSLAEQFNISISPNPSDGEFNLHYDFAPDKTASFELYDVNGKLLKNIGLESGERNLKLDEKDLNAGIYFCRVIVNGEVVKTEKIIIN